MDRDLRAFPLHGKRVVVGVSGGIAAYKAAELVRLLVQAGAEVHGVMTRAAQAFITPLTLQALSGHPVGVDLFDLTQESEIWHIKLAETADLVVVAPATADVIARLACGLADDLLTTLALVTRAPMLLAPAMNTQMWEHPMVAENVRRLLGLGRIHIVGPGSGPLACRTVGPGRLAEPAEIVEAAGRLLTLRDLTGRRILVTAGPTHEAIDPVRFVSNRSSGKMGYAIARAAAARGARVVLVSGPTSLPAPMGVEVVAIDSATEMGDAVTIRAPASDVIVMAAAVADYTPLSAATAKLKKSDLGDTPTLELKKSRDVLAELGRTRRSMPQEGRRPVLVGFAAETERLEANARHKLASKGCDLVVANDVSEPGSGFEVDTNHVTLVGPGEQTVRVPRATKDEVAHKILDQVLALLHGEPRHTSGTSPT